MAQLPDLNRVKGSILMNILSVCLLSALFEIKTGTCNCVFDCRLIPKNICIIIIAQYCCFITGIRMLYMIQVIERRMLCKN